MDYETCEFGNLDFRIHFANFFSFFLGLSSKYDINNHAEF